MAQSFSIQTRPERCGVSVCKERVCFLFVYEAFMNINILLLYLWSNLFSGLGFLWKESSIMESTWIKTTSGDRQQLLSQVRLWCFTTVSFFVFCFNDSKINQASFVCCFSTDNIVFLSENLREQ